MNLISYTARCVVALIALLECFGLLPAQAAMAAALPAEAQARLDERNAAIERVREGFEKQKADLFDKYAAALEREVLNYQNGGDLQNLLAVKKEQKAAKEERATTDAEAPALASYRKTLQETLTKHEDAVVAAVKTIDEETVKSLVSLRTQLTQSGEVEEAVMVDRQIKTIEGAVERAVPQEATLRAVDGKVADAAQLRSAEPWVGNFVLEPKRYLLRDRVVLGRAGSKNESQKSYPARVFSPKGCRLEKGEILIDEGLLQAEGTHFSEMTIRVDLGGTFEARDSLFEQSWAGKGGAWFVKYFSSKWTFDNCAFTGSFIREWKVGQIGVKVTNCTFHDVAFSRIDYQADAGDEVKRDWMTIVNCRFVNCKIPESLLVATQDCVFEDCLFLEADTEMKILTPIKTRIFVNQRKSVPEVGPMRIVDVVDLSPDQEKIGASLHYKRTGKSLSF